MRNIALQAHEHLLAVAQQHSPLLLKIIETNGVITLKKQNTKRLFEYLAQTVSGQQLSKQAAGTIWSRVCRAAQEESDLFTFCRDENSERLRQCGLSKSKVKAILGIKHAFESGALSPAVFSKPDHQSVIDHITALWGFGRWSADMMAIFFCALPDVWSDDDVALQRGLNLITANRKRMYKKLIKEATPYRSYLAMHVWKALDDRVI